MSLDRLLEQEMALVQARATSSHPTTRQPMPIVTMANLLAEKTHRWLALNPLRLATGILRCARRHYLQGVKGPRVALSAPNLTQRMAALPVLGPKQSRCRRDKHWTTNDGQ
jgi:hypothetical protein